MREANCAYYLPPLPGSAGYPALWHSLFLKEVFDICSLAYNLALEIRTSQVCVEKNGLWLG